jgi:hypothetical protein
MRCVACGAEMLLVKEHLVFNRERLLRLAESAPSLSVLTLACVEADRDLDESEALLKRAMEMVRAPTRSSRRVVRIEYDPRGESTYVAKDTETGHVVLRHNDRARLRVMCEQFQWKMVEGELPSVQTGW